MMFLRTESFKQFVRLYPVVTTIITINIVLFILTNFISEDLKLQLSGQNILIANGDYYRLVSAIFVHFGLFHIVMNCFGLILFGPPLEKMLGKTKFIVTYLLMGIIGNVGTYYLGNPFVIHAGASGAIYGLFGLYLFMILMKKHLIDYQSRQIVIVILVIGLIMTFIRPGINIYAHIFGLIAGLALGPLVLNKLKTFYY